MSGSRTGWVVLFTTALFTTALAGCASSGGSDPFDPADPRASLFTVEYEVVCSGPCWVNYSGTEGTERVRAHGSWRGRATFGKEARGETVFMGIAADSGDQVREAWIKINGKIRDRYTEGRGGRRAVRLRARLMR